MGEALENAFAYEGPSVIITRWPCALKKFSKEDIAEFDLSKKMCRVNQEKCRGCQICVKTGCPAISFDQVNKKASINKYMCIGCTVCKQACPFEAIEKVGGK